MESIKGNLTQGDFNIISDKIIMLEIEQDVLGVDHRTEIARLKAIIEEDGDMFDDIEDEDEE
jgi:hypothetical protein